jgi:glycosyltransferase involved in cell wall biosynthesis
MSFPGKDPATMKLTVVMPVYNEAKTIHDILAAVQAVEVEKEIVIVDDYSTDGTRDQLADIEAANDNVRVMYHEKNQGKGAALRTGIQAARGEIVVIQDADLEYDPQEYPRLIEPINDGRADVVYGSRFAGGECHRVLNYWHAKGNLFLTRLSNWFTGLWLTDMETCYKVFKREIIQAIDIEEDRFGFEPEITAKLAALRVRMYEVAISYEGRGYEEGKKIGAKDGFRAIWAILKFNLAKKKHRKKYLPKLEGVVSEP